MAGGTGFQATVMVATPVTRPTAAISDSQSKILRLDLGVGFRRSRIPLTPNAILPSRVNSRKMVWFA
jgi:hypothetical protein